MSVPENLPHPLQAEDLTGFVDLYTAEAREPTWTEENPDGRWRVYEYDELVSRDKANLDLIWLKDNSLLDAENLPEPEVLSEEIAEDLRSALEQVEEVAEDLAVGS